MIDGFDEGTFALSGETLVSTFFLIATALVEDFLFEDLTTGLAGLRFVRLAAAVASAFGRDGFLTAVFVPAPPFSFPCTFGMRDLSPAIGQKMNGAI
ncbi:MAG TPA: hypothetical protein VEZ11_16320 [Thermoanaerobaculia bacterium]|nr:hypothetical protein [Thermoanaerobaculia bacterium]